MNKMYLRASGFGISRRVVFVDIVEARPNLSDVAWTGSGEIESSLCVVSK